MDIRYTRHAILDSMPDEKISKSEVEAVFRKAELRTRIADNKFRFGYRDLEVVCVKTQGYWLVVTCYSGRHKFLYNRCRPLYSK